jgi:hypothetical protein
VIELHGIGRYAGCCLRDDGGRFMKHVGRGCPWDALGNHESLDIEPADEIPDAGAGRIGINVADIPGEPERRVWNLNRERSKSVFGGRPSTTTSRFSNSPKVRSVTVPWALGRHAFAPADTVKLNWIVFGGFAYA